MKIQTSKDYDKFVFLKSNRPTDIKRVVEMERYCIESHITFLEDKPINVNSQLTPGYYTIMDGQHRFELAKRLSEPVYFIDNPELEPKHIIELNANQKSWRIIDYINFYAANNVGSFKSLKGVLDKFPDFPVTGILAMYTAPSKGEKRRGIPPINKLKRGKLPSLNFTEGDKVLNMILSLFDKFHSKFVRDRSFIYAFTSFARHENFNLKVWNKKLEFQTMKFVKCSSVETYIKMLCEIYNYKNSKKIYFQN